MKYLGLLCSPFYACYFVKVDERTEDPIGCVLCDTGDHFNENTLENWTSRIPFPFVSTGGGGRRNSLISDRRAQRTVIAK